MKQIIIEILKGFNGNLQKTVDSLISTVKLFFQIVEKRQQANEKKKIEKKGDEIDDICNKGNLDELFDLKGSI